MEKSKEMVKTKEYFGKIKTNVADKRIKSWFYQRNVEFSQGFLLKSFVLEKSKNI